PGELPERKRKLPGADAPAFDWCVHAKPFAVQSQHSSASCWAHAAVAALEWNWMIRNQPGRLPGLAAQPLIDRAEKLGGASIGVPMEALLEHGTCLESAYPYTGKPGKLREGVRTPYRIVGWGRVAADSQPTVEQLKKALLEHGPVTASVYATPAFKKY